LSYFVGQHYAPVKYPIKDIAIYTVLAAVLWGVSTIFKEQNIVLKMCINTLLLLVFATYIIKKDLPLKSIPFIRNFIR
ncbi:MAG: lipopolysaccharide biosynthesis protein, partial [Bacteroidaceae bacterium]|nr:lipopolysaccharide biosynthesis protein [Bacteroidaceae bacterium]